MGITKAQMERVITRVPQFNPEPELFNKRLEREEVALWRKLQKVLNGFNQTLDDITVFLETVSPNIAYQAWQITAADLEASDDPNDVAVPRSVLTTNSVTIHQFNWMRAGGLMSYRVVLTPGDGSASHDVIIDRDDANLRMAKLEAVGDASIMTSSNVCRPYGMEGLKLQFGEFRPAGGVFQFWPSSVAVGTFCYLEQMLPMVHIP